MSHSWLSRQRKQNLLDLSAEAGLPQNKDTLKDDIVEALDAHLRLNAARFSSNSNFAGYFNGRSSTPFKSRQSLAATGDVPSGDDASTATHKPASKPRARKPTKIKSEAESDEVSPSSPVQAATSALAQTATKMTTMMHEFSASPVTTASAALQTVTAPLTDIIAPTTTTTTTSDRNTSPSAATRTPAARRRSELPGPPSPSVVADVVEQEARRLQAGVDEFYRGTGVAEGIAYLRETCSSVVAVQTTFLLLEAYALQRHLMPWNYAFDLPGVAALGVGPTAVFLPDLFVILTGYYWSATLTWAATSLLVPGVLGYFYNLTLREARRGGGAGGVARYTTDPLSFNIAKALATWLVYVQGLGFGAISPAVAERVDGAIYGGSTAVLIGSGIGILAALYDAAQRK
ncbi:uncharacterized protein K489DRAFT_379465 [Dissoconium aciculare CBS 342.82]|uniref:Uncharacterized protein n=1 Tax=Dissoconium aciculare CBS 342.82 TaxID=1314786 RepID=A0A6J3M5Z7_9PEZI|nr:uncharacterized protein K489DRAFT_379465 [Dissoconium aciculare CBS 342.82]KAF1823476.1 hypothetical protein K489DRAFT_379465 [Dissoconium aciculare CBS 342.82]